MAEILSQVTLFVTESIDWVTAFATVITDEPLLLMFVIVSFVGLGVGLIKRLIRI